MYYIYIEDGKCPKTDFSQIGIKIRKMNSREIKKLSDAYDDIYSKKAKIHKLIRDINNDEIFNRLFMSESTCENPLEDAILYIMRIHEIKPIFHKDFKLFLNKIFVVEFNNAKLSKYIESKDFDSFVRKFFDLAEIYNDKWSTIPKHSNSVEEANYKIWYAIKKYNLSLIEELMMKYIFDDYKNPGKRYLVGTKYIEHYCISISQFLKNIKKDDIFRFVEITEMYFLRGYIQNLVINNVFVIEGLIVRKNISSISRDFSWKASVLLIKNSHNFTIEQYNRLLDFIYNIRSDIVHGNNKDFLSDYNALKCNLPGLNYPDTNNCSEMRRKKLIMIFSYKVSRYILNQILKEWFSNPEELYFIKNS